MRIFLVAALVSLFGHAAEAAQSAASFDWVPLARPDATVKVNGAPYVQENAGKPWSIERAKNSASEAIRFEVRMGDQWKDDAESGENKERSELDGYRRFWTSEAPVWGAYAFLIEPGNLYSSDWTAISQMHGSQARPFALQYRRDELSVYTEHLEGGKAVQKRVYSGKLDRGVWHNVVFKLTQSSSDGRLELWLDGNAIVDARGPIGTDENKAYWKFGVYRGYGPIQTPIALEYANMEIGNDDLSSRIRSPLPVK